jgi:arylformamidase
LNSLAPIIRYLSYPITKSMPVYGGSARLELIALKAIDEGDSCNTWRFFLENHWRTHVDGPNHFFTNGRKIIDYPANFWIFNNTQVLDMQLEPGELLRWKPIDHKIDISADLLLVKSGWGMRRKSGLYWKENPGIHADVGIGLRHLKCSIRIVGIDWISISSLVHREEGRKTHQAFLNPDGGGAPVLLIEDMDLSADLTMLSRVFVAPLIVEGIDSAPSTVIGVLDD